MLQSFTNMGEVRILLASNSPRRRQLISLGGWQFDTVSANVDESLAAGETPAAYVLRLAQAKARAAAAQASTGHIIIGADTTVVIDGDILGKPADETEATSMLRRLRGRTHQVYTGIAVLDMTEGRPSLRDAHLHCAQAQVSQSTGSPVPAPQVQAGQRLRTDLCVTDVPMRAYAEQEISAYVRTGDPLDKAGAYAIQHPGFQPVAAMAGCYASVMGLPLCHLTRLLREFDLQPQADLPAACQAFLRYDCPVYSAILGDDRIVIQESR